MNKEDKPIKDEPKTIKLNPIDAQIGNTFLKYLVSEHAHIVYPVRMMKMIMLFKNDYALLSTIEKGKMLVIEAMLRHIHSHGEKRFKKFQKELKKYMGGDNILYVPVGTELKFIPANWNDLWKDDLKLNIPDL